LEAKELKAQREAVRRKGDAPKIYSLRPMKKDLEQQDKLDPSSSDRAGLPSSLQLHRDKMPRLKMRKAKGLNALGMRLEV